MRTITTAWKNNVDHNGQHFNQYQDHIDTTLNNVVEHGFPETAWHAVAPTIEADSAETMKKGFHINQIEIGNFEIHRDI